MGPLPSRLVEGLHLGQDKNILMLGLEGAGKTTILQQTRAKRDRHEKGLDDTTPNPTIGFHVVTVNPEPDVTFTLWDVGGQNKEYWEEYYAGDLFKYQGLIFVVDSSDPERFQEAKHELSKVIGHPKMGGLPTLVVANKRDLPGAATALEMAETLELPEVVMMTRDRKWHVQETCAKDNVGVREGMRALALMMTSSNK